MDQHLWLKSLNFHGSLLLQTILGDVPKPKSEAEKDKQIMCQFIKKRLNMLFKQSDPLPSGLPKHSVPIVPIELYQEKEVEERRDLFYKSLDRGHILILRVINDTLPDNYKLLVLCKEENHMKLDDLSIVMYLPKLKAELDLVEGKLEANDLIRAAVCSCSIDERKLYVTLHSNILEDEAQNVKLGKMIEDDLPFYMNEEENDPGPSYVDYLKRQTKYYNDLNWADELEIVLGLDRKYLYSFMENMDGKTYAPIVYADELRKKQILQTSDANYVKGLEFYNNGKFPEAFSSFDKALRIHSKNVEALVSRGILHANTGNKKKAFLDLQAALKIERGHERASRQMSILLAAFARDHIEHEDLNKAQESLEAAINCDSNNKDALTLLEEVRKMKFDDKHQKTSKSGKKDRDSSTSSRSEASTSKKDELEEKQDDQGFNLEAATKKFLTSMKKHHKDHKREKKKRHLEDLKSQSKSKSRSKSPKSRSKSPKSRSKSPKSRSKSPKSRSKSPKRKSNVTP